MNSFLSPITTSMNISFSLQIVWMGGAINNISAFSIIVNLFHLLKYSLLLFFLRLSTILSKFQIHMHFKALLLPLLEGMPHRVAEDGFQRALQFPPPQSLSFQLRSSNKGQGMPRPLRPSVWNPGFQSSFCWLLHFSHIGALLFPCEQQGFFLGKKC